MGQRFEGENGGFEGETGEIPQNQGKKGTQWGKKQGFAGAGDKKPFSRARDPLVLYDFKTALIFWFSQNAPLEPKGPFVTSEPSNP